MTPTRTLGVLAAAAVALAVLPGSSSPTTTPAAAATEPRVAQERYAPAAPLAPVDCSANVGGACFDLVGDESRAVLLVQDDVAPAVRARYDVLDGSGAVLAYGIFCDTATVSLEKGAAAVVVSTGLVSADCTPAAGPVAGGAVTATFDVGAPDKEIRNDGKCVGVDAPPPTLLVDDGAVVDLDVHVLVDGPTLARAQEVFAAAQATYDPLSIRLRPRFEVVSLPVYTDAAGAPIRDMATFADRVRDDFGLVPEGFDLVHVFTTKQLSGNGVVLCIGGVTSKVSGFGVSEDLTGWVPMITGNPPNPVPYWPYGDATAKVVAHELGHQLGGQHHLSNCVEGDLSTDPPSLCTVMDGSLGTAKNFSRANALVVRAHAAAYASLNDADNRSKGPGRR